MQVVLEIDPRTEARVRELAARGEFAAVKRELEGPLDAAVRQLAIPPQLPPEEFERLADELARVFTAGCDPAAKPLSHEALTREGIYGDHP